MDKKIFVFSELLAIDLENKIKDTFNIHNIYKKEYTINFSTCWSDHASSLVYSCILIVKG